MKKKNLKVQVAALAMTGAMVAIPMNARAEEVNPASAATTGTMEVAAEAATGVTSGAAAETATGAIAGVVAEAGTGATVATAPGAGTASGREGAVVTVEEAAVDPGTTAPNNVNTVLSEDQKQGTDISTHADITRGGQARPVIHVDTTVTAEDAKGEKTIVESHPGVEDNVITRLKNKDVVLQGDLSIKKDESTEAYDSTNTAAHPVNKEDSYSLKADLDVSPVTNAINASSGIIPGSNDIFVNNLETGLRSTFTLGDDLEGSFHLPTDLEDAKKHYELSSADGNPMIYRINYGKSSFSKKKVSLVMDLDLTQMKPLAKQGSDENAANERIYGKDPVTGKAYPIENFNPSPATGRHATTSVFGNLQELINNSAQKIQLVMKGLKINATSSNRVETETATEKNISTEGSIAGTLVGYMKSDLWYVYASGNTSYVWGAVQNDAGRDKVSGQGNDKVLLTVKINTVEPKNNPVQPVNPVNPEQPAQPVNPETPVVPATPVNPRVGGTSNGGGGRSSSRVTVSTVSNAPTNPGIVLGESRPTASTPSGEVLGENRVAPVAETVEKKQGTVLGESRPSVKGVSDRASVATGDYNFTGLWASLFGISLASLAGFVVLKKKEQQ
ncbi:cell surface protein [Oribacterium sinus]|uniref:cell surface protein n=1 Tax=Oribacterium sinus TaxID=237576 RepID=UPI0028EFE932|nr:cell surface protein [Oribacterium sinus]